MGHRALVAYERTDGNYNVHYTHWGACNLRLKQTITSETPFGGDDPEAQWPREVHDALTSGVAVEAVCERYQVGGTTSTDVDPLPRCVDIGLETIITEELDYIHHEALYVVTQDFEVTAYRTLWFGLQYESEIVEDGETVGNGALATVRWYDGEPLGDSFLQGKFQALKDVVGDMIDRGVFSESAATEYMTQKVISWVGERQDVRIPAVDSVLLQP